MAEVAITVRAKDAASRVFRTTSVASKRLGTAVRRMGQVAGRAGAGVKRLATRISGLRAKLGGALGAVTAFAGRMSGLLLGGFALVGGAIAGTVGALKGMREALEETGDASGGVGDKAEESAGAISDAVDTTDKAAQKMQGVFGAFGDVGAGFVQSQGRMLDQVEQNADSALGAATASKSAIDKTDAAMKASTQTASRFGKALDRIGGAFNRAKNIILRAVAKAILPALEKFADMLESPTFKKFVDLVAENMAKAVEKLANWLIEKVIPALEQMMEEINEAGGVVDWIKGKFSEFKSRAWEAVQGVISYFRQLGEDIGGFLLDTFLKFQNFKYQVIDAFAGFFEDLFSGEKIETALAGLSEKLKDAFKSAFESLTDRFPWIEKLLGFLDGGGATEPTTSPGSGGLALTPNFATASPTSQVIINVTVPAGTANPAAFGNVVGENIVTAMRRSGQRIPVT